MVRSQYVTPLPEGINPKEFGFLRRRNRNGLSFGRSSRGGWDYLRGRCRHSHENHIGVLHSALVGKQFRSKAANVEKWGATQSRVSWHDTIGVDGWYPSLPWSFLAWQAKGYNRCGISVELVWDKEDYRKYSTRYKMPIWEESVRWGAKLHTEAGVPLVHLTQAEVDHGNRGFVGHGDITTQPWKKHEPFGDAWAEEWPRWLEEVRGLVAPATTPHVDPKVVTLVRGKLVTRADPPVTVKLTTVGGLTSEVENVETIEMPW